MLIYRAVAMNPTKNNECFIVYFLAPLGGRVFEPDSCVCDILSQYLQE
jgi:hypothetical protein